MGRRLWKYFFSITAKNFLYFGKSTVLLFRLCRGNQKHHSFPPRYISQKSTFCDNGLFEEQNRKTRFIGKLEHWCWKESICINFRTSRLSLQQYLGSCQWVTHGKIIDSPAPATLVLSVATLVILWCYSGALSVALEHQRVRGYSLPNLPPIHRLAAGDRYGRAQDIRNTKNIPKKYFPKIALKVSPKNISQNSIKSIPKKYSQKCH